MNIDLKLGQSFTIDLSDYISDYNNVTVKWYDGNTDIKRTIVIDNSTPANIWVELSQNGKTFKAQVNINIISGVEDAGITAIEIFPNPTTGVLTLKNATGNYRVLDSMGKQVLSGFINQTGIIDLHKMPYGTYFIKLANPGTETRTFTVVKR